MARFIIAEQTGSRSGATRVETGNFGEQVEEVIDPALATANSFGALEAEANFRAAEQVQRSGQVLGGAIAGAGAVVQQFADRQRALEEFDERQEIQFQNKDVELAVRRRDAESIKAARADSSVTAAQLRVTLENNRREEFARYDNFEFRTDAARGIAKTRTRQLQAAIDAITIPGGDFEKFQLDRGQARVMEQVEKLQNIAIADRLNQDVAQAHDSTEWHYRELLTTILDPVNATLFGGQEQAELILEQQAKLLYSNFMDESITRANTLPWMKGTEELRALEVLLRAQDPETPGQFQFFLGMSPKARSDAITGLSDEREKIKAAAIVTHNDNMSDLNSVLDDGGRIGNKLDAAEQNAKLLDANGKKGLMKGIADARAKQQNAKAVRAMRQLPMEDVMIERVRLENAKKGRLSESPAQAAMLKQARKAVKDLRAATDAKNVLEYGADQTGIVLQRATEDGIIPNVAERYENVKRIRNIYETPGSNPGASGVLFYTKGEMSLLKTSLQNRVGNVAEQRKIFQQALETNMISLGRTERQREARLVLDVIGKTDPGLFRLGLSIVAGLDNVADQVQAGQEARARQKIAEKK
jgi:hypothetical protein